MNLSPLRKRRCVTRTLLQPRNVGSDPWATALAEKNIFPVDFGKPLEDCHPADIAKRKRLSAYPGSSILQDVLEAIEVLPHVLARLCDGRQDRRRKSLDSPQFHHQKEQRALAVSVKEQALKNFPPWDVRDHRRKDRNRETRDTVSRAIRPSLEWVALQRTEVDPTRDFATKLGRRTHQWLARPPRMLGGVDDLLVGFVHGVAVVYQDRNRETRIDLQEATAQVLVAPGFNQVDRVACVGKFEFFHAHAQFL